MKVLVIIWLARLENIAKLSWYEKRYNNKDELAWVRINKIKKRKV